MWRGIRCLRALLRVPARDEATRTAAAAAAAATRALRVVNLVSASSLDSRVALIAQQRGYSMGRSELRGAEEAVETQDEQEGQPVRHQPQPCPETDRDPSGSALSTFSIDHMVSLLRQENAKDICVIQLPPEIRYSDYFIIVSGSSTRHLCAMAQYLVKVFKHLKTESTPHVIIEGKEADDWLCIDFGNIVVHFMLPETREIYELEKLWTLRSYDDQLAQMVPESLPDDLIFDLPSEQEE